MDPRAKLSAQASTRGPSAAAPVPASMGRFTTRATSDVSRRARRAPCTRGPEESEGAPMPALRPRLTMDGPLLRGGGELHIVGRREVTTIHDPEGAVHRLLCLANGTRTRAEILAAMTDDFPQVSQHDVDDAIDELESMGLLQDAAPRGRMLSSSMARRSPHDRSTLAGPRAL